MAAIPMQEFDAGLYRTMRNRHLDSLTGDEISSAGSSGRFSA
jgi:hypothetical protein